MPMPIVAGVDRTARARTVVEYARDLADLHDTDLHIMYVERNPGGVRFPGEPLVGEEGSPKDWTKEIDVTGTAEHATEIATMIGEEVLDTAPFEAVGRFGDPANKLLEYSAEQEAEAIVVSGRKLSRVGRVLVDSVTQSLLFNADRPVVVVPHRDEDSDDVDADVEGESIVE